ncbi:MAG: hypothetical protein M1832_004274 [Thelocarpon impressellum]|nr:MAG: hypothetical protein M1832_004274 [Thelocarpon impressellum]
MKAVVPSIEVTDAQSRSPSASDPPGTAVLTSPVETDGGAARVDKARPGTTSEGKPGRSGTLAISRSSSGHGSPGQPAPGTDQRRPSQAQTTIDPLSQHILKRTHTESMIPPKLRAGTAEGVTLETRVSGGPLDVLSEGLALDPGGGDDGPNRGKNRKGVSFLSRFIGGKKKNVVEEREDDASEMGDDRIEGMDANVFSQPIQSYGYTPRHLLPPEYIKVRSHNKKEREFNRVFLAQELAGRAETPSKRDSVGSASARAASATGAIWALEFSKDGRHLAAGGQDKIVRVWAVISTAAEREAHEKEEDASSTGNDGHGVRLNAPVFKTKPTRVYEGHTADVLDLSWSKNNFLLSSSMDKTVRLWHVSRGECLCCFKHSDFVTSIAFHPRDDRFFLAGSLDSKLRLWSIPDKSVAFWNQLPDLITAVAFTPDGKMAMAGCLNGLCLFYETEGLKYHTQIHVRSTHGRNAKGSKVTGIQSMSWPPEDSSGEVKMLITSNDSRVRLYNFRDKSLEMKFKGHENTCSQIRATFSDDARHVICGSEDRKVYIWGTGPAEGERKERRPVEMFAAHSAIVTTAIMAPTRSRQLLSASGDPLYDLCNPPPVTLASRAESQASEGASGNGNENGNGNGNGSVNGHGKSDPERNAPKESPGYVARSHHDDGNIIVTADYMGKIKVFRQDCAFQKRRNDAWETSSTFSKRFSGAILPRSGTRNSASSSVSRRRNSLGMRAPAERIMSWRNSVSNPSLDGSVRDGFNRSVSPRKSPGGASSLRSASARRALGHSSLTTTTTPSASTVSPPPSPQRPSLDRGAKRAPSDLCTASAENPLMLEEGGQSMVFWNLRSWSSQKLGAGADENGRPSGPVERKDSRVSSLSSEADSDSEETKGSEPLRCKKCGGASFRAAGGAGAVLGLGVPSKGRKLACRKCGTPA